MKLINQISEIDKQDKIAITIGNFDGFHLGHQKFLEEFISIAKEKGLKTVLVSFDPHPLVTLKNLSNFLINSKDKKISLLSSIPIDFALILRFDRDFSLQTPQEFLHEYILKNSNVELLYLGFDFSFGENRTATIENVQEVCKAKKCQLYVQKKFSEEIFDENRNISSTALRKLIKAGAVFEANKLLGRPFESEGLVVKGEGKGRKIGFPTANLMIGKQFIIPQNGVYITKTMIDDESYFSVTNIGVTPTFNQRDESTIETHILDFNRDIYGQTLQVSFLKRLRDELKFSCVNQLIEQIKEDVQAARDFLCQLD